MSSTPPPTKERQASAALFLAFVDAAKKLGVERETYAAASPELRAVLDNPPLRTALIPGPVMNEFYRAVAKAKGRDALRAMSLETMRGSVGQLLARLFESTIRLYGRTPEALLSQFPTIAAPITRGYDLRFEKSDERAGWLHVRPDGQPDPLAFAVWEGAVLYFFDVAEVAGTVGVAELRENGHAARIRVSW